MRIIICPDSFKGSLSSIDAANAIEQGINSVCADADVVKIPLADGGEGTVDALVRASGGDIRTICVRDPIGREIDATYGMLAGGVAVIEMAAASGLCLLSPDEHNPLVTSTYGTGQLIRAALDAGVNKIVIGIGGSATNDGGAGAITALGARFLYANGSELPPGGAALADLDRIDMSDFVFPAGQVEVEVACDVNNPLCGPMGASAIYGPQKGATPEMVAQLDAALARYAKIIKRDLGRDVAEIPGAGAAGGLGAGLVAFLAAKVKSGIDMVLDTAGFDEALKSADLVITGEGRIDEQTACGKTIGGVLRRSVAAGVPVIAIAGSVSGDLSVLRAAGLVDVLSLVSETVSVEYAIAHAAEMIEAAVTSALPALMANLAR